MKGREQGTCAGCGRKKGSHDSNAGWWEMGPRRTGGYHLELLFCPPCSGALLVGLDERLTEGKKNPNLIAVLTGDLDQIALLLNTGDWVNPFAAAQALDFVSRLLAMTRHPDRRSKRMLSLLGGRA